jgi:hypothetical protein
MVGLSIVPHMNGGDVDTSYQLVLEAANSNTTNGVHYGIFQADNTFLNFFNGKVGIGTSANNGKLEVAGNIVASTGQIYSAQSTVASGATADFNNGNVIVLQSVSGSTITVNNMRDGGSYTVVVADTTPRTYTFANCTNAHFQPANASTSNGTRTVYSILKTTEGGQTHCYIAWIKGFN